MPAREGATHGAAIFPLLMERVVEIVPAGHWQVAEERDRVTLPYHDRHRRRLAMRGEGGVEFLLDLAEATLLREGDGLRLSGGGFVAVRAMAEALLEVTAHSSEELALLAWHLGNRHLPAEIAKDRILIHRDHVIADMLRGLGAHVREVMAPFNPASGAYHGVATHAHGHSHRHDDDHAHHDHGEGR